MAFGNCFNIWQNEPLPDSKFIWEEPIPLVRCICKKQTHFVHTVIYLQHHVWHTDQGPQPPNLVAAEKKCISNQTTHLLSRKYTIIPYTKLFCIRMSDIMIIWHLRHAENLNHFHKTSHHPAPLGLGDTLPSDKSSLVSINGIWPDHHVCVTWLDGALERSYRGLHGLVW